MAYLYPELQWFDADGNPLAGGFVNTYVALSYTRQPAYTTQAGDVEHTNPVELDAEGRAQIWLAAAPHRIIVTDADEVQVGSTIENYNPAAGFGTLAAQEETFTATAGQTAFTLTEFEYTPGINALTIFQNGLTLTRVIDYTETDTDSFTLIRAAEEDDEIIARAGIDEAFAVTDRINYRGAGSDRETPLTTGTTNSFRLDGDVTITGVRMALETAQTSGNLLTIDVKVSAVSIFSTRVTIDNSERTSTTATTPCVINAPDHDDDEEVTIIIDQIGDGTAIGLTWSLLGVYR